MWIYPPWNATWARLVTVYSQEGSALPASHQLLILASHIRILGLQSTALMYCKVVDDFPQLRAKRYAILLGERLRRVRGKRMSHGIADRHIAQHGRLSF